VRKLNEAGIPCGVLMAPIIPFISDTDEMMERTVKAIADAGATHISPIVLHLRKGGAREWWMTWLAENRPELVPRYRALYEDRTYSPKEFQKEVAGKVHDLARRFGIGRTASSADSRRIVEAPPQPEQLTLA
jgi:DNA repair photolyase